MPGEQEFYPGNASQGSEEGSAVPTHHEVHLNCFGVMLRIDSRNALPSGQRGRITVPAKHFFSEILRLPGTGIAKMRPEPLCWPFLGLCWPICCLCWGPCSPILRLCWGYVGPSWRHVGPCCGRGWTVGYPPRWFGAMLFSWLHRHSQNFAWKRSPQWPARHPLHFCNAISLKKLTPAGDGHTPDERLKAPTSGLRGSRRRFPRVGSARPGKLFEGCEGDMCRRCGGLEAFGGAKKQLRNPTRRNCGGLELELEAFESAKKQFRNLPKSNFGTLQKRNCSEGRCQKAVSRQAWKAFRRMWRWHVQALRRVGSLWGCQKAASEPDKKKLRRVGTGIGSLWKCQKAVSEPYKKGIAAMKGQFRTRKGGKWLLVYEGARWKRCGGRVSRAWSLWRCQEAGFGKALRRRNCGGLELELEAFESAKKQFRNPTKRNCGQETLSEPYKKKLRPWKGSFAPGKVAHDF